ncbi:hypothetical protein [Nocardia sp. MW-W600-9]
MTVIVLAAPPDLADALTEDGFDTYDGNLRGGEVVDLVFWTIEHREVLADAIADTRSVVVASAHVINAVAVLREWFAKRHAAAEPAQNGDLTVVDDQGGQIPLSELLAELSDDAEVAARIEAILEERRGEIPPPQD